MAILFKQTTARSDSVQRIQVFYPMHPLTLVRICHQIDLQICDLLRVDSNIMVKNSQFSTNFVIEKLGIEVQ